MVNQKKTYHIAMLPSPGIGHFIPLFALAKRIISLRQGFRVTIFVPTSLASPAQAKMLHSSKGAEGIEVIQLPPTNVSELVPIDANIITRISATMKATVPNLRSKIVEMVQRPNVLVVDVLGTDAFDLADELGLLKYIFVTTTAKYTALQMYLPTLDKEIEEEFINLKESIKIPGCKPIEIENLMDSMRDRKKDGYKTILHQAFRYRMAHGILINTCEELEPRSIRALKENTVLQSIPTPPVYPIGPLTAESSISKNECIDWLNKQPSKSVLFLSFGSGGTQSAEQITELAWGLELSQERFIWMVRAPTINGASGTYFTSGDGRESDPSSYLPEGFLNRTKNVGLVVTSWCPQLEILKHESIGGCLSHCGWNSSLECIVNGVPMITWPLYAEQKLNATTLIEDIGVAIRPSIWPTNKLIERKEIEKMVRLIMKKEDEKNPWRVRAKKLKNSVLGSLDECGSSHKSLLKVAKQWKGDMKVSSLGLEGNLPV